MSAFTDAVAARVPSLCIDEQRSEFAAFRCDSCGLRRGGACWNASYCPGQGCEILTYIVCEDCVLYHANGDEPESWVDA